MKKQTGIITGIIEQRGFGFIEIPDGQKVFFQALGVCDPTFDELREGHRVEFMTIDTPKGTKAIGVRLIETHSLPDVQGW